MLKIDYGQLAGKNRPLDEEDLAFVNSLVDSEQVRAEQIRAAERSDLDLYQAVRLLCLRQCTVRLCMTSFQQSGFTAIMVNACEDFQIVASVHYPIASEVHQR